MTLLTSVRQGGHTYLREISDYHCETHDCSGDISEMRLIRLTRLTLTLREEDWAQRTVRSVCGFR